MRAGPSVVAERRDGLADFVERAGEQAVVAAIEVGELGRQRGQLGPHAPDHRRPAGQQAVERLDAAAVAGEQLRQHLRLAGAERPDDADVVQVQRHESPRPPAAGAAASAARTLSSKTCGDTKHISPRA